MVGFKGLILGKEGAIDSKRSVCDVIILLSSLYVCVN